MTKPITITIPHKLGRTQVRDRIERGTAQLAGVVPGSVLKGHRWDGDVMTFTLEAMGQSVATRIEVMDEAVNATVDLPPVLALFANKIRAKLLATGTKLIR